MTSNRPVRSSFVRKENPARSRVCSAASPPMGKMATRGFSPAIAQEQPKNRIANAVRIGELYRATPVASWPICRTASRGPR